jgi:predicted porin
LNASPRLSLSRLALLAALLPALPLAAQATPPTVAPAPAPAPLLAGLPKPTLSIYGIFDIYAGYTDAGGKPGNGSIASLDAGGYSANRIGFLGSEEIGGGYKANLTLENGFMSDSGGLADGVSTTNQTSRWFNRQCWVGFSGPAGEVRFGRQNTILQTQLGNTDPFNGATFASFFNNFSGYASRFDNILMYKSPVFNGVALQFQFAPGELPSTKTGLNLYVASIEYTNGGLYLLSNWQMQKSANTQVNVTSAFSAASYDFQKGKVYAGFYRGNNIGSSVGVVPGGTAVNVAGGSPNQASNYNNVEGCWYDGYEVSAIFRLTGKFSLGGGYGWAKDLSSGKHNDVSEPSLIATYDVSKKLMFYSTWGVMQNKNNAQFFLSAGGPIENKNTPAKGKDEGGFQIGARYLFGGALL